MLTAALVSENIKPQPYSKGSADNIAGNFKNAVRKNSYEHKREKAETLTDNAVSYTHLFRKMKNALVTQSE